MSLDAACIRQKDHPVAVRGDVGKPVVGCTRYNLLLTAAVRVHSPNLHRARAFRVEVNPCSVGRIFWTIVKACGRGQPLFVSAAYGNGVDIEVIAAQPSES